MGVIDLSKYGKRERRYRKILELFRKNRHISSVVLAGCVGEATYKTNRKLRRRINSTIYYKNKKEYDNKIRRAIRNLNTVIKAVGYKIVPHLDGYDIIKLT